jgi:hypothetical protein
VKEPKLLENITGLTEVQQQSEQVDFEWEDE